MKTIKLYDDFPYNKDFSANIISVNLLSKNPYYYSIILNQTLFFPESGGQSCDKGIIVSENTVFTVESVTISDDIITHIVSSPSIITPVGNIKGCIDWEHRFSNMQQHTGEHIFSGLVYNKYGFNNVGFHLSDNTVTMDFDGFLDTSAIKSLEKEANKIISQNSDITCFYPSSDELCKINYRCKKQLEAPIRLVNIEGVDTCACCCPHLHKTGEVGLLKIISSTRYKKGVRISFLCGFRAISYFDELLDNATEISATLSKPVSNLPESVNNLLCEKENLTLKLADSNRMLLEAKFENLIYKKGPKLVFLDMNLRVGSVLNDIIKKNEGVFGLFLGNDNTGYSYMLGSSNSDLSNLQKLLKDRFNAKGGGKTVVQGFIKAIKSDIVETLESI